jgi:hypothetical protein
LSDADENFQHFITIPLRGCVTNKFLAIAVIYVLLFDSFDEGEANRQVTFLVHDRGDVHLVAQKL